MINRLTAVLAVVVLSLVSLAGPTRAYDEPLGAGWNLVGGLEGPTSAYVADHPCVLSVFSWDAEHQHYLRYYPYAPDYVNAYLGLPELNRYAGYWVWCDGGE